MAYTLQDILGGGIPAGLLNDQQMAQAQRGAEAQGLLALGLNLLAGSRGMGQRPSTGQVLGQAGMQGLQAYRGAQEDVMKRVLQEMQLKDMLQKRQQQQQLQSLIPEVFKKKIGQVETTIPTETYEDYKTTAPSVVGYQLDPNKLQALMAIPGGMEYVKNIAETNKALRQAGLGQDGGAMISPFAPYLMSDNPQVKQLAQTYEQGFQSGRIDADTADKRALDLAKMQESFEARTESSKQRAFQAQQGREERAAAREEKKLEGTESQKVSAGFANRMEFSNAILDELEVKKDGSLNTEVLPTAFTSTVSGIPFAGDYFEGKAMTTDQQKYKQAARNWIRANLRKESGAAIPPDEMDQEYRTYFPVPSDDPQTIEQKRELRKVTTKAMIMNAGPVYKPYIPKIDPKSIKQKFNLE